LRPLQLAPGRCDGNIATVDSANRHATLLALLHERIEQEKRSRLERAAIDAPDFDAFAYFHPNENTLSRMLADLLDPRGPHGQGPAFLQPFLESLGLIELKLPERAHVRLECQTLALDARRRIDIVITGKDWVIGIENKPQASDQPGQVADYLSELQSRCAEKYLLIYLTTRGTRPTIGSIGEAQCADAIKAGTLRLASYEQLLPWLQTCRQRSRSERVAWYLEALERHIQRSLLGHLPVGIETMIHKTLLDEADPAQLTTALELLLAKDAIQTELRRRVSAAVAERLGPSWQLTHSLEDGRCLSLIPSNEPGWAFGVELEGNRCFYGISFEPNIGAERRRAIQRAAEQIANASGKGTKWWPWWRWFEGVQDNEPRDYDNWESSVRPWEDMANGVMAENFAALATRLRTLMER
jgi:hypothetical protein